MNSTEVIAQVSAVNQRRESARLTPDAASGSLLPMKLINLSASQLRQAADIKEEMERLQEELDEVLGAARPARLGRKRGNISAASRARIAAAQRARWANHRKGKAAKAAERPKRKISSAARARLAQLAKVRWAKAKAAGKTRL